MTAEPAHAESRIEQVTLYARGARVRRAATHTVGEGASRLRLTGLPVALLDDSVRVEASGGALVTAVHVGLDAAEAGEAAVETSPALRAAQERL
ncbi:MAG TPA: DUF4140 domain-containing protein, partial [Kofleriaceae bacterium]|nr:DUF4140 domain-containing protein [Kofleriaceae bacterium]